MSIPRDGFLSGSALSSSPDTPIESAVPIRRPSNASEHVRRSPTLARSFDPDARERQRTMDVDMAMHLSRARRETISISPEIVPVPERLQGDSAEGDRINHSVMSTNDTDDELSRYPSRIGFDMHLSEGHDPGLIVHPQPGSPSMNAAEPLFGLPSYQQNASSATFDFTIMEEFATMEKANLGLSTGTRFSLDTFRPSAPFPIKQRDTPAVSDQRDEPITEQPEESSRIATGRHRAISQSNSHPRSHRKGIGGKMALFETPHLSPGFPSLPARLGLGLSRHPGSPVYDSSTAPQGGILHTGHDRPYRFSFYSNALAATIHARSLCELPAEGQTFEDLFTGDHPHDIPLRHSVIRDTGNGIKTPRRSDQKSVNAAHGGPQGGNGKRNFETSDDNTWWLDVTSPTEDEMKMLSKVFSIHPLTIEDILMEETREKIELFRNYYFVCFRSFDQDQYGPTYLEPLNMYIIVFREGTLSFHFRPTPHPQNVRRRIKQLKDYISVTSDWISYALIDDITDAFGPLIQNIEYEVDSIDELVLILKDTDQSDMLRRIGTCRKKVMGLLRLMGNKADVVKGLAKRCNENWRVAPTSDIGLYLSDIQDHLITMTQNLNHYEKILSRSHSNYLAQISIEMTEANNQINDVLSKLTALGTVLIPMNLVTGLWGMNVHVPGQEVEGYAWFISIIACLAAFAVIGGYSTYRLVKR